MQLVFQMSNLKVKNAISKIHKMYEEFTNH